LPFSTVKITGTNSDCGGVAAFALEKNKLIKKYSIKRLVIDTNLVFSIHHQKIHSQQHF
jgi:hypothetical protein